VHRCAASGTARTYVALAAGGDLGALVPLVAARLVDEPLASFLVFYGHYGEVSDAALEELLALKTKISDASRCTSSWSANREGELLSGKLDADKLRALSRAL